MKAAAHLSVYSLLLAGLVSLTSSGTAHAQAQPLSRAAGTVAARPTVPGTVVAVVDVSYIFENHAGFKNAMEQMKSEVQQYEEQLRARHQGLAKQRDQMIQFTPGSPEYEQMERSIADAAAKLQVDTQLKKKEFLTRESKLYFSVYNDVSGAVQQFAEMKGIDLVLRYNGAEMKSDDRTSVLQGVNRALVYQRNLDITREILDRLNRTQRPAAGNNADPRVSRQPVRQPSRTGR